jgi:single-strand DNA-binding protein
VTMSRLKICVIVLIAMLPLMCEAFGIKSSSLLRNKFKSIKPSMQKQKSLFRCQTYKLLSSELHASDDDEDDNRSPQKMPPTGGNFFESVPPMNQKQQQKKQPMSYQDLEMMCTPFDEHLPKINVVTLVGRVGNNPEPKYFDDGKVVLNLSLAVRRKYHPLERKVRGIKSGEEETDWFPLEFWGRDAEYVTSYVEKGARIGITGSLVGSAWVDKRTGEQRRKAKILVRQIDILESRAEAELRKGNKVGGQFFSGGDRGRGRYDEDGDDDGGPNPASTGGFFDP